MNNLNLNEKNSEFVISTTLYRALFLLKELQKTPLNLQEMKQIFQNNEIIGTKISDDTIRMTLATLKSVGCIFSKPSIKNNFRYELVKSPFLYEFNDENIEFLKNLREEIASYISWNNLLKINDLYEKLNLYMVDNDNQFALSSDEIFLGINKDIIKELTRFCKHKTYINILYNSQNILKSYDIIPVFLKYENNSVYLWAYNDKRQNYSYFNVKRIKKINKIITDKPLPNLETYKAVLKISKDLFDYFSVDYKTQILENSQNYLKIEIEYLSEFHFIQKIFEAQNYVEVLESTQLRDKIINKLKNMMELYKQ